MVFASVDDGGEPERIPSADEARAEIEDWKRRIGLLFDTIQGWLPPGEGYEADRSRTVPVDELMMRHLGIPAYRIPLLEIRRAGADPVRFIPDARWVYNTRGRVMILGTKWPARLLDKGTGPEDVGWRLYATWVAISGVSFDTAAFRSLLGERR
ncbi:MAG TPA: hypothetical protein VGE72_05780 [Azospirillum sp.]